MDDKTSGQPSMLLRPLGVSDEEQALQAHEELAQEGFEFMPPPALGLERVLVTCDDDNVGSAKVIENCGGVLENVAAGRDGSAPKRRYWVEIGA